MPISLPPLSRRGFLGSLAATAALLSARRGFAAEKEIDPHRLILFSDIHIAAKREEVARGTTMFANLEQAAKEVLAESTRPAAVLVNGDCAYLVGSAGDYATLLEGLKPLREAGLTLHLGMGNHDKRETFWEAFALKEDARGAVQGRQLAVIETPRANVFLLDSLDITDKTPGVLGEAQRAWLAKELDARAKMPAIVMVHHNPDERPKPTGLTDTKELYETLLPRKNVKLLIYGHTHDWNSKTLDGLHCVNLPPVAYVFKAGKPNGWVDLQLQKEGATLQLRCLDATNAQHLQKLELKWR